MIAIMSVAAAALAWGILVACRSQDRNMSEPGTAMVNSPSESRITA